MTASPPESTVDRRAARRAVHASFAGTVFEYYDFSLYATAAAAVFPTVFFPGASPFLATLQSVATFSVAFLIRPFGGAILGSIGDRVGRRSVLVFAMVVMGFATIAIGFIPGARTIGWVAPVLLLVLRVLQGVGASAEFSGATLVAVEYATERRQGLLGSIPAAGNGLGGILGTVALLVAQTALPRAEFLAWGWRIPFLLGGVLVAYGLWTRAKLPETPAFRSIDRAGTRSRTPVRDVLRQRPRSLLAIMLIVLSRTGLAYFFLVFLVAYSANQIGLSRSATLIGLLVTYVSLAVLTPFFGWLSDLVGRVPVIVGGLLLEAALAFPLFLTIRRDWPAGLWLSMFLGGGVAIAACVAPIGRLVAEILPVRLRYGGMGLANETGIAIGGAVVPPLAVSVAFLEGAGTAPLSLLLVGVALLGFVGLVLLPRQGSRETAGAPAVADPPAAPRTVAVTSE